MAGFDRNFLGIHLSLLPRALIFTVLGVVVFTLGLYIIDLSLGFAILGLEPNDLSAFEFWILLFSGIFLLFIGLIGAVFSPIQMFKASSLVLRKKGKTLKIRFEMINDSEGAFYKLRRLDTLKEYSFFYANKKILDFLDKDLEATVYLNQKDEPKAVMIKGFLIWLM